MTSASNGPPKDPPDLDTATIKTVDSGFGADAGPAKIQATETEVEGDTDSLIEIDIDVGILSCVRSVGSYSGSMLVIPVTTTRVSTR
jgi:hypothetical protein